MGIATKNIRHELDQKMVQASVAKKIARYERQRDDGIENQTQRCARYAADPKYFDRPPLSPETFVAMYDNWIAAEREHYAAVRVIELPQEGDRYVLIYGAADDATVTRGTGPFATFQEAAGWFYNGGR